MTLFQAYGEVTQKLGLLKALIGFLYHRGEESKRKAEPRTRSASRLSLAEMKRFELLRRGTLGRCVCHQFPSAQSRRNTGFFTPKPRKSPIFRASAGNAPKSAFLERTAEQAELVPTRQYTDSRTGKSDFERYCHALGRCPSCDHEGSVVSDLPHQ